MGPGGRYWFPAKRYGWGWGFPITWQGWSVFIGFLCLLLVGAVVLLSRGLIVGFVVYTIMLGMLFAGVCWLKGEPPRWRWG